MFFYANDSANLLDKECKFPGGAHIYGKHKHKCIDDMRRVIIHRYISYGTC